MYNRKLLMMGREGARNRKKIGIISASGCLFKKKSITMHGNMNVKINIFIPKADSPRNYEGISLKKWELVYIYLFITKYALKR